MSDSPDQTSPNLRPSDAPPGVPRWVKLLGIIAVVAALLFLGLVLAGHVIPVSHTP